MSSVLGREQMYKNGVYTSGMQGSVTHSLEGMLLVRLMMDWEKCAWESDIHSKKSSVTG
jgi:hypothetical protein